MANQTEATEPHPLAEARTRLANLRTILDEMFDGKPKGEYAHRLRANLDGLERALDALPDPARILSMDHPNQNYPCPSCGMGAVGARPAVDFDGDDTAVLYCENGHEFDPPAPSDTPR